MWEDRHPKTKLHRSTCDSCKKSYDRCRTNEKKKYHNNEEYRKNIIKKQIEYNETHPEIFKPYQERYYNNHKEERQEYARDYQEVHKEEIQKRVYNKYHEDIELSRTISRNNVNTWREDNKAYHNFYQKMLRQGIKVNKKDYNDGKYNG